MQQVEILLQVLHYLLCSMFRVLVLLKHVVVMALIVSREQLFTAWQCDILEQIEVYVLVHDAMYSV